MSGNRSNKCKWCLSDPIYEKYHDEEWGVPTYDSHYVFSFLLESSGSWNKINFKNDRLDEITAAIGVETNIDTRNQLIAEGWDIIQDNIPYLPLHHQVVNQASKSNVDVPIRPNNEPLFRTASFN